MTVQPARAQGPKRLVLLLAVVAIAGCTDLRAIREFADTSAQSAQYTALVDDYVAWPERQKRYLRSSEHQRLETIARQRAEDKARLLVFHQAVEEYMSALGELASDEAASYDAEFDGLGNAVKGAKFLNADQAGAAATIARVLTEAAADGWRRRKLDDLIEQSNASFQVVVGALQNVVSGVFAEDVAGERAALRNYYVTLSKKSRDPAGRAALAEWQELRQQQVQARGAAVDAYAEVLARIGQGHQDLYDNRDSLSTKALLKDMKSYAKELKRLFKAVRKFAV